MQEKLGIYLNKKELKAVRISSPYWIPSGDDWVLLTPEVNTTILAVREMAREKNLAKEPEKIDWGQIPVGQ